MTRTAISRPLIPVACFGLLLGMFQTPAYADPVTPFPPGGEYAGETMPYSAIAQLLNPILNYVPPGVVPAVDLDGDGFPDDYQYNVMMFLSATVCVSGPGCGPGSASGMAMIHAMSPNNMVSPSDGTFFDTEMLSMELTGGSPFGPMMIRESPTLRSLGRTTTGPGPLAIDSFFDIFTEISFANGPSDIPVTDQDGSTFTLREIQEPSQIPEPATLLLLGTGFAVMARSVRRRNRKT